MELQGHPTAYRSPEFLDRLVGRGLARRIDFRRDRGHVYHVNHSALYDATAHPDKGSRQAMAQVDAGQCGATAEMERHDALAGLLKREFTGSDRPWIGTHGRRRIVHVTEVVKKP